MSARSLGLLAASFSLVFAVAATAAPAKHSTRHHETRQKVSGPALIVRGDQVSTEGLVDAVAEAFAATGDGHLEVTPFNTVDGIDQTLAFVAQHSAPGSLVVFDYMYESLLRRLHGPTAMRFFTRAMGEDITFGIDGDKIVPFLTARGFGDVLNVDGAELERRYLTGTNAGRPMAYDAAIVSARVR